MDFFLNNHHGDGGGGGEGAGLGGIQMIGLVNALKTGNVALDMMIAMTIPVLFKLLFNAISLIHAKLMQFDWARWYRTKQNYHERNITYKQIMTQYGGSVSGDEDDTQNQVLIKAIQMYAHVKGNMKLRIADLALTSIGDTGMSTNGNNSSYDRYDEYGNRIQQDGNNTMYGMLSAYSIVKKPPKRTWHTVGSFGKDNIPVKIMIEEMIEQDSGGGGGGNGRDNTTAQSCFLTELHIRSRCEESIDSFVATAYNWYLKQLKSLEDDSRYMYEVKAEEGSSDSYHGSSSHRRRAYKRYKLSDEKTFESLFFQEKSRLLEVVDHFVSKSGKYAIKGYPHKLGLLLHGPPGTGKTSLIKALAQYTGRSIVNISLSKISTNSELMSLFFDQRYCVKGEPVPLKLGFEDVIFVMEDVDATSKVVRRRDGKKTADVTLTEHVDLPPPKSLWRILVESSDPNCKDLVGILMEKSDRLKSAATSMLCDLARRPTHAVPGLSMIGEGGDSKVLSRISNEAEEAARKILDGYDTVDRFLGVHAGVIKSVLDTGAEVDLSFEDILLGQSTAENDFDAQFFRPRQAAGAAGSREVSYDVSYKKYADTDSIQVESTKHGEAVMNSLAAMLGAKTDVDLKNLSSKESGSKPSKLEGFGPSQFFKEDKDQLNLSGLLNVLDGVVDTPGRIVIMTTNHPELLDPALIRPGRIDKKLMLGYMRPADVISMIEHYFKISLDEDQKHRIEDAIDGSEGNHRPVVKLTPAQVEQYACEWDDVDDMIYAIEKVKGELIHPPRYVTASEITIGS